MQSRMPIYAYGHDCELPAFSSPAPIEATRIRRGSGFAGIIATRTGTDEIQPHYLEHIEQSSQNPAVTESLPMHLPMAIPMPVPMSLQSAELSAGHAGEITYPASSTQQAQPPSSQLGVTGKITRIMNHLRFKRKASDDIPSPPSKRGRTPEDPGVAHSRSAIICPASEISETDQGSPDSSTPAPLAVKSSQRGPSTRKLDSDGRNTANGGTDTQLDPLCGEEGGKVKQKLNANEINDALARMSHDILETTESVLVFLGLQQKRLVDSPCVRQPSEDLKRLYETCWGPEWSNIEQQMEPHDGLSASNVLRALTACYVHCFIFNDASTSQDEFCSNLNSALLADAEAERLFFALAIDNEPDRLAAVGPAANLYPQPLETAVQEDQSPQSMFDAHAHAAASRLTNILQPHIQSLVNLATVLQKFQGEAHGWCSEFTSSMATVFSAAIDLKCRLIDSNYKYGFFWPTAGSPVDTTVMKLAHKLPGRGSQEVAFTLFPGIRVDFGLSRASWPVKTADVVARLQANNAAEDILMYG
ncbi:uncharacterized protein MYCFIDRAFT_78852 [Pseudocercospora fijiensis CIRAD86]|uniref:Uncharacterized protein n=1 Tax=Pseudocercospora fijiensis (strain CIRAD86) TaxID=383855 RepID=M3AX71_PSEFD|nr:uncharacterized protein MYCFIDRAFT_78852 [Pseudocercospora fijiensis CIRAD86]EME81688.1 hypothetical protein MYCFIDRAFT_78852 [Pseudocercospora fijiensis CIRAD86]